MYKFRTATRDDLPGIVKLRERVEGGNKYFERSERYYNWKFFCNPNGKSIVKIALDNKGCVVGLMSVNPKCFLNDGVETMALEWGDFFTHERHQRKGIFSGLCQSIFDEIRGSKFYFSYIRPNNNSYPIVTTKLGFSDIDELEERLYFVDAKKLLKNRLGGFISRLAAPVLNLILRVQQKQPGKNDASVVVLDRQQFLNLQLAEGLFKVSNSTSFCMLKNREYLEWRYFATPIPMCFYARLAEDLISDYLIVAFDKLDGVYLVDFLTSTSDGGTKLMDVMLNDIQFRRKKYVSTYVRVSNQGNDELCTLLKKYRFRKVGANLHFVKHIHKTNSALIMKQWQFRLADIDGV